MAESFSRKELSYPSEFIPAISLLVKSFVQNQMVNTRRGSDQQGQNNQGQNTQGTGIPMPPPLTPEQYFQLQMQMMATLNNTVQALQQLTLSLRLLHRRSLATGVLSS